jgi:chain length determinant protein tyrosine kinase EpsG
MNSFERVIAPDDESHVTHAEVVSRPLGSLLRESCKLNEEAIERILAYQGRAGLRFGEAAVALHLVDRQAVLQALSRQFHYTPGVAGSKLPSELVAVADPFGEQAEAFRELRSRLMVESPGEHLQCALAVVSPDIGDGKTYLAANLAVSFSQLGEKTLLVDADIRTPRQHKLFGVKVNGSGLSRVLAGFADADDLPHQIRAIPNLYVAPAGPVAPNPIELVQRPGFAMLMREFLEEFDHVVVDTPAAIRGADSRVIAARCGAALVVARRDRSGMGPLEGLVDALARGPARIAGVVMNEH